MGEQETTAIVCEGCGFENRSGMRFCVQCGTALIRVCPACGAENPPGHMFCGQCGKPLGRKAEGVDRLAETAEERAKDAAKEIVEQVVERTQEWLREETEKQTGVDLPGLQACKVCEMGNPPDATYCALCGAVIASAGVPCPGCSTLAPPGALFCDGCGQRLGIIFEAWEGE